MRHRQFGCHGGLCRDVNGLFHEKEAPSLHPNVASAMEMKEHGRQAWEQIIHGTVGARSEFHSHQAEAVGGGCGARGVSLRGQWGRRGSQALT